MWNCLDPGFSESEVDSWLVGYVSGFWNEGKGPELRVGLRNTTQANLTRGENLSDPKLKLWDSKLKCWFTVTAFDHWLQALA